ncbi:hypothetical protein G7067_03960 [Leucobacter insecticola]|uniref:Uncharacterized protein n=1 Tax=Leucobacter insecticola TaxID=2714934 RepID=A0A6G8FH19_9MICO|nr:hypothetical protein [Leucobacter insecticola]QIM15760.1 hypothetical protein G7067_03960 [Leucobacter insecticola]
MIPAESGATDPTIRVTWLALPLQFFLGGAVLGIVTSVTFFSGNFFA